MSIYCYKKCRYTQFKEINIQNVFAFNLETKLHSKSFSEYKNLHIEKYRYITIYYIFERAF